MSAAAADDDGDVDHRRVCLSRHRERDTVGPGAHTPKVPGNKQTGVCNRMPGVASRTYTLQSSGPRQSVVADAIFADVDLAVLGRKVS